MSESKISLASQLSALERAIGRLNGTSNNALTPGQSMLEQRDLGAALDTLERLRDALPNIRRGKAIAELVEHWRGLLPEQFLSSVDAT